jgi:hypothetical protein
MTTDRTADLHAATRRRATNTRARARATLRRLNQQGATINYVTVAQAAGVSRSLLYRDPELRAEIDRLRNPALTTTPRQPAAERMSQATHDEIHAALRHEVKELRRENQALRTRLAATLGEQRGQIHQPHSPVNDMSPTT